MRIAVVGSHGTGKTTLCKGIIEEFNFNYIPDVVRTAYENKFEVNENTLPETQFWILSKQLELERNTEPPWVSEKSLWDNIVYGRVAFRDKEIINVIKKLVIPNANYDLMFYCPIEFPLQDDGLRSMNSEFQRIIDEKFRKLLKIQGVEYINVRGNELQRITKVKRIVSDYLRAIEGK